jgi:hypothetical protein
MRTVAKRAMPVDLAQRHAVGDDWQATKRPVGDDVGSIQQFPMAESADRATGLVRQHHLAGEHGLV